MTCPINDSRQINGNSAGKEETNYACSHLWVRVKIKPQGDRRFWSLFPFTRVPFGGCPIFDNTLRALPSGEKHPASLRSHSQAQLPGFGSRSNSVNRLSGNLRWEPKAMEHARATVLRMLMAHSKESWVEGAESLKACWIACFFLGQFGGKGPIPQAPKRSFGCHRVAQ